MILPKVGLPVDAAQWAALALGVATLVWGRRAAALGLRRERWAVGALAVTAALLSWGYVVAYLRGGPRIIDATSYYLEARALSEGRVSWPAGEPEVSALGRFLVRSEGPDGARAAVLFPPGYPLLLAVGFLAGAPLAVGPLLAAALVVATWWLGREVTREEPALGGAPLLAAALSVVCGVLRYHTADTMSHGLAALCFTLGAACLLRARYSAAQAGRWGALAGLWGGWLFATRPASGLAWGAAAAVILVSAPRPKGRELARIGGAAALTGMIGALGWLLYQRAATGHLWLTTHAASYALNDGPEGCFRYGFGEGIGCVGEHGDFVRANLPEGFGLVAAMKTTARRLWMHLGDAANAEPLGLLVPLCAALAWRRPAARAAALAVVIQIAAYAPFYFDGNYPGGGARFYADVLPLEHVLLAIGASLLASRAGRLAALARGSGAWIAGLSLLGLAVRGGFDHAMLRDRDGGAPAFMPFDPNILPRGALLFVEGDAAYNLAFDPEARARGGFEAVRLKGDAVDTAAWLERGSPPSYSVRFEQLFRGEPGGAAIEDYEPRRGRHFLEGESLWPPRARASGAFALPVYASGTCARGGRALRVFAGAREGGSVTAALPALALRGRRVELVFLLGDAGSPAGAPPRAIEVALLAEGADVARERVKLPQGEGLTCVTAMRARIPEAARALDLWVSPGSRAAGDPLSGPYAALDHLAIVEEPR